MQQTSQEIQGVGALQGVVRRIPQVGKFRLPGVVRYEQLKASSLLSAQSYIQQIPEELQANESLQGPGGCPTCGVYGPGVIGSRHSRSAASKAASLAVEMSFSNWVRCSSY